MPDKNRGGLGKDSDRDLVAREHVKERFVVKASPFSLDPRRTQLGRKAGEELREPSS